MKKKIIDIVKGCLKSDNPFDLYWFIAEGRKKIEPFDNMYKEMDITSVKYDTEFNNGYNIRELETLTLIADTWNLAPNVMGVRHNSILHLCGTCVEYKAYNYAITHYIRGVQEIERRLTNLKKNVIFANLSELDKLIFNRYIRLVRIHLKLLNRYRDTDKLKYYKFVYNCKWQREVFLVEHLFNKGYKFDAKIEDIIKKLEGDVY